MTSEIRQQGAAGAVRMKDVVESFEVCYRAVRSRDRRFDGRIFTAVTSTGIYCRPSCPAQTPKAENVRFYRSAAAAEAAGFRACKRCHPDRLAAAAAAAGETGDLLGRALRMIADGSMDEIGVAGLARRLRITPRHLHRELVARVGAGPLQLARTRRAQTARLLIDRTSMPLTEVAMASGYASIRQFNASLREVFGKTPSELRRAGAPALPGEGPVVLRLAYRSPFDAQSLFAFLGPRAIPGVEEVLDRRYRRVVRTGRTLGVMELDATEGGSVVLRLRVDDLHDLQPLVQAARTLLDLDAEPAAVNDVLAQDRDLRPLVLRRPGMRVPGTVDAFEMAVRAVLGQQVSVSRATTLAGQLTDRLGEPLPRADGGLTHAFPTPERLAGADLSGLGLTGARAATLHQLARAVAGGRIDLDPGADRERTAAALLELPGIGPWTVAYLAMRALRDPDAIPITDLGIRKALDQLGAGSAPRDRIARTERWRPWRAYAAMHLWASLSNHKEEALS